jgi:hypothetical protein
LLPDRLHLAGERVDPRKMSVNITDAITYPRLTMSNIKATIRHLNRWDFRGFGWQEIFLFGFGVFFPGGIMIGFVLAIIF